MVAHAGEQASRSTTSTTSTRRSPGHWVRRTPEAFLFDGAEPRLPRRHRRPAGRGRGDATPAQRAVEVVFGGDLPQAVTPPVGCTVKWLA